MGGRRLLHEGECRNRGGLCGAVVKGFGVSGAARKVRDTSVDQTRTCPLRSSVCYTSREIRRPYSNRVYGGFRPDETTEDPPNRSFEGRNWV